MAAKRKGKTKKVSYELIPRSSIAGSQMYPLLDRLVDAHHEELLEARIALAWCTSWKPDVDGKVVLGKCKKASDLDREMADFDFIVLLSKPFWLDLRVSDAQRAALLDHELCHGGLKFDDKGEPIIDERDRKVYRVKRHDIEEFTAVVRWHGLYKSDLVQFFEALPREKVKPFTPCAQCADSPGFVPVVDAAGVARVQRCACWKAWAQQNDLLSVSA